MNDILVELKNVKKVYKSGNIYLEVLKDISLEIKRGEILAILGQSGSGKSTLLNLIGGLDNVTSGNILINNREITLLSEEELTFLRNKMIGFVFQFHNLLMDFTAIENIMLPYLANNFNWNDAKNKALKIFEDINLKDRANHKPGELSGGEQQRVAIARALINSPQLILADEPTGNLDQENSENIRKLLWNIVKKYNTTLIVVTHNTEIAKNADRVLKLDYGHLK